MDGVEVNKVAENGNYPKITLKHSTCVNILSY